MEQETTPREAFEELDDGEEVAFETSHGAKMNREVRTDTPERDGLDQIFEVVHPSHTINRVLTFDEHENSMMMKTIEDDGSLSVPGQKVTWFRNFDQDTELTDPVEV